MVGLVYAKLGHVLADEDALHAFWRVMGSSGNLLCMFCQNVVRRTSELADHKRVLVDHTEGDITTFISHTDASLYAACDRLRACPPARVAEMQTNSGVHLDLG